MGFLDRFRRRRNKHQGHVHWAYTDTAEDRVALDAIAESVATRLAYAKSPVGRAVEEARIRAQIAGPRYATGGRITGDRRPLVVDSCGYQLPHHPHPPMTGPERVRAAIDRDRGRPTPTPAQGFA